MAQIRHRIGIKADTSKVNWALTTDEGLAGWWTDNTSGAGELGSVIDFRFGDVSMLMKVIVLQPGEHIAWECISSPALAWISTEIHFKLVAEGDQVFVNFSHIGWPEADDFYSHCSTKWAVFMLSLKQLVETGTGAPAPNDTQIDHN